jgi:hypothetical protein
VRQVEENNVVLYSNYKIEISESQDESYLNVKFIICNFDVNRNGVMINRDTVQDWLNTLIMKPLVGLIKLNKDNELDFTSHEAKKVTEIVDGKPQQTVKFGTDAFGVFDNVQIETIDGIEYITANARIWRRFTECCKIIQDRFNSNEPLNTSWEIAILDSDQKVIDGQMVKVINEGIFVGHCLLSKYTPPAYPCSGMLEVAEEQEKEDSELMQAFINDLNNINNLEVANQTITSIQSEISSVENKLNNKENDKGGLQMSEKKKENKIEKSSLTSGDIQQAIINALWDSNCCFDTVIIHPVEQEIIIHQCGDLDENCIQIPYTISDDGTVTLGEGVPVQMVFIPRPDFDSQMAELTLAKEKATKELDEINADCKKKDMQMSELKEALSVKETELSSNISAIVDLGKNIAEKETVIAQKDEEIKAKEIELSELKPFKEELDKINAEKEALEIAQKKEDFKNEYLSTKLISENDLEIAEVKDAIEALDNSKMELFIAQKVIAKAKSENSKSEIEVSEVKEVNVEVNINATTEQESKKFNFADAWK